MYILSLELRSEVVYIYFFINCFTGGATNENTQTQNVL